MKFYTWLDLNRYFLKKMQEGLPDPIRFVQSHWGEVECVYEGSIDAARSAFKSLFAGDYYKAENDEFTLANKDILSVAFIDATEEGVPHPYRLPLWRDILAQPTGPLEKSFTSPPPAWEDEGPALVAFASFKGGVGRTTHLLASLAAIQPDARVLVVDADLEAPGFSFWASENSDHESKPDERLSFIDFVELIHATPSPDKKSAIDFAASEMVAQYFGSENHYVMPAFRGEDQFLHWPIKPEHLVSGEENPWVLNDCLRDLGKALKVNFVLVDLRAGLNEISSSFLLDPRFDRYLVSTLSAQSIQGTRILLELLAKSKPDPDSVQRGTYKDPKVILSMVHPDLAEKAETAEVGQGLLEAYYGSSETLDLSRLLIITEFDQNLLKIGGRSDFFTKVKRTDVFTQMEAVVDSWTIPDQKHEAYDHLLGETSSFKDLLIIPALRKLAQLSGLPSAIVLGSKGSGKTFVFLQMLRLKSWGAFRAKAGEEKEHASFFFPFLESKYMADDGNAVIQESRGNADWDPEQLRKDLDEKFRQEPSLSLRQWEQYWLNAIIRALGLESKPELAAVHEAARQAQQQVVLLIDGLEDIFWGLDKSAAQGDCLRSLLDLVRANQKIEAPSFGILMFLRKDLSLMAIRQNWAQFFHPFREFELVWDFEQMLRLANWYCEQEGYLKKNIKPEVHKVSELEKRLYPIWGAKMGGDTSREARTSFWVYSALADFHGKIQARDVVHLLNASLDRHASSSDRLISPQKLREGLKEASQRKVEEAFLEFPSLKKIHEKMQDKHDQMKIPFRRDNFDLKPEDWNFLKENGILFEDQKECFLAEIYRHGLGFSLTGAGRPRLLSLQRKRIAELLAIIKD